MWICISPPINISPHRQEVQVAHDEVSVFCCISTSICSNSLYCTVFCIRVTTPEMKVTLLSEGVQHSLIALASVTSSATLRYLLSLLESIIKAQRFAVKQICSFNELNCICSWVISTAAKLDLVTGCVLRMFGK